LRTDLDFPATVLTSHPPIASTQALASPGETAREDWASLQNNCTLTDIGRRGSRTRWNPVALWKASGPQKARASQGEVSQRKKGFGRAIESSLNLETIGEVR